jgi:hypothetical protein
LLPLLAFYLVEGAKAVTGLLRLAAEGGQTRVAITVLVLFLTGYAFDHFNYVIAKNSERARAPIWLNAHEANESALRWMREHLRPEDGVIATNNPALSHLYTGSATTSNGDPAENWELWKTLNVRYLAYVGWPVFFPPPRAMEAPFRTIYQSPGVPRGVQNYNLRVLDLGPVSSRPDWQVPK